MAGGEYYIPPQDEIDGFNELLAEMPDELFTAENVATLAGDYWQRRAAGKTLRLRVPGAGIDWVEKRVPAAVEPPAAVQGAPEPATPQPPQGHPNPAIEQAAATSRTSTATSRA